MATMQGIFPGSRSHLELCRRNFTNHVMPHLQPRVTDVFQNHFTDSYDLIRTLLHEQGKFQTDIALSAIGIRAFRLVEPQAPASSGATQAGSLRLAWAAARSGPGT